VAVGVMRSRQVMTGAVVDFGGVVAGQGHLESFRYPPITHAAHTPAAPPPTPIRARRPAQTDFFGRPLECGAEPAG
jgi:hypothetical protein